MALKENYKDDILDTSQNVKRKYQMENNGDGTVSFTDVTEYTQQGDSFGSGAINPIAHAINGLNNYNFHPSGSIDLVAYVADDSYYLNEDNKYVLADSTTGQALITSEPSTYKALASDTDLYGIEGEDTVSGFEPSCTPITVEGQTLSTIDDKLNFIIEGLKPPTEIVLATRRSGHFNGGFAIANHNNNQHIYFGATLPSNSAIETMTVVSSNSSSTSINAAVNGRFKYAGGTNLGEFVFSEKNCNAGDVIINSTGSESGTSYYICAIYAGDAT